MYISDALLSAVIELGLTHTDIAAADFVCSI